MFVPRYSVDPEPGNRNVPDPKQYKFVITQIKGLLTSFQVARCPIFNHYLEHLSDLWRGKIEISLLF